MDNQKNNFIKTYVDKTPRIILGMKPLLIVGLIFQDVGMLMLASIICTMGITLILYIPLCISIGASIKYAVLGKTSKNKQTLNIMNVKKALVNYINQAKQANLPEREIRNNLKYQGGWKDEDINKAFEYINTNKIEK